MPAETEAVAAQPDEVRLNQKRLLVACVAIGAAYGLSLRLLAGIRSDFLTVMSVGFIFLMPFALGFISIFMAEIKRPLRWHTWIWLPCLSLVAALLGTLVTFLEGAICIAMYLVMGLPLAIIGGVVAGVTARYLRSRRARGLVMAGIAVLPFVTSPWEQKVFYEVEMRRVENVIDIEAPPSVVWRNIERVPAIRHEELPPSWAHAIGFPDPIEATLSHEGVGGVRNASFAGNLNFIETIDVWESGRRLGFTITVQADKIPPTTLDEHVRIGGAYFDMLRGEYSLEPLPSGATRLHLSSRQRVSTDFNWYAHLWTDAIMSDLQKRILFVIQQRCQKQARG